MSRLLLSILLLTGCSAEGQKKGKPVLEYGENDFENLYDEWEDNDEDKLEPDELPYGHPDRPARPLDLSGMDMSDPQSIVRASKAHKPVIMLVTVSGEPSQQETDDLTLLWEMGLQNNHIEVTRYPIEQDRVLDGATAWEVKDYLVEQERVELVEIDQETFPGKYTKPSKTEL